MSLVDEYLAITGRPAFTLTVDEFLKLREPVKVQRQKQEREEILPVSKETVEVREKEEEVTVSTPAPHKEVQENVPVKQNVPIKNTQSNKKDILSILKSIPG